MNSYAFMYKSIGITWFMVLTVASMSISYIFVKRSSRGSNIPKSKLEDIFFLLVISGFIGARVTYGILNFDIYKDNLSYVFKLSHFNLSLVGGVVFGLFSLVIMSKKDNINLGELLKIFTPPFYISMSFSIWIMFFDGTLVGKKYSGLLSFNYIGANRHLVPLYLSILFILAFIVQRKNPYYIKDTNYKVLVLLLTMIIYYLIKIIFTV